MQTGSELSDAHRTNPTTLDHIASDLKRNLTPNMRLALVALRIHGPMHTQKFQDAMGIPPVNRRVLHRAISYLIHKRIIKCDRDPKKQRQNFYSLEV